MKTRQDASTEGLQRIREALSQVRPGEPQQGGRMTVVPLIGTTARQRTYMTLEEALGGHLVEVTELGEGGSVPELRVHNKAPRPVLILDGAVLLGAKQNRMVNLTILVPPESWTVIPVSCVEAGRWSAHSRLFEAANHLTFDRLRRAKARQVSDSLRTNASRRSDQRAVWAAVGTKLGMMGSHSPTSSLDQAFQDRRREVENYIELFRVMPGQVGAVFLMDGRAVGLDLFDHEQTFASYLPKLLRGIALDALEEESARENRTEHEATVCEDFLKEIAAAEAESYAAVGLGLDVRLRAPRLTGGGLVVDGTVLHMAAFRDETRDDMPGGRGRSRRQDERVPPIFRTRDGSNPPRSTAGPGRLHAESPAAMTVPLIHRGGHLFLELDGRLWFLDTGAPASFSEAGAVTLANRTYPVAAGFMGLGAGTLSSLVGVEVCGLLGADVLSRFDLVLDVPQGRAVLSAGELEQAGIPVRLEMFMGIPIVPAEIGGAGHRMFFDTGAQYSYLQDDAVRTRFPQAGRVKDFFPGAGEFETETNHVAVGMGGLQSTLRCGRLPGLLGMTLGMAGAAGVIGNEVLLTRKVGYFPRRRLLVLGE